MKNNNNTRIHFFLKLKMKLSKDIYKNKISRYLMNKMNLSKDIYGQEK